MKEKIKEFFKLSNEDIILIVLALMSFSNGIWLNYRQLWLQGVGFDVASISRILSVSLVCSAIIIFFISFFSTKIKLKNVIMLSIVFRAASLLLLTIFDFSFGIKFCMLLCIMCEKIFSVAFYPFLATVNKSNRTYQKHALISYVGKDLAVILAALMLGVSIGNVVFDYGTCLFLALMTTLASAIILLLFQENKITKKRNNLPFKKAFINLFKSKNTNMYLLGQLVSETSYAMIFGMIILLLTNYLGLSVSFASIFIIGCNLLGSFMCTIFNKYGSNLGTKTSTCIKYGARTVMYILAFIINTRIVYILAIVVGYICTRILDDKVNGVHIRSIRTDSQFLFGNIRYFVLCISNGIGVFIAGLIITSSIKYLFLVAGLLLVLSICIYTLFCETKEKVSFNK